MDKHKRSMSSFLTDDLRNPPPCACGFSVELYVWMTLCILALFLSIVGVLLYQKG